MSSIGITKFGGRYIDGGCVPGTVTGILLPDPEVGHDMVNGSSEISSNISDFNKCLKFRLFMLR